MTDFDSVYRTQDEIRTVIDTAIWHLEPELFGTQNLELVKGHGIKV